MQSNIISTPKAYTHTQKDTRSMISNITVSTLSPPTTTNESLVPSVDTLGVLIDTSKSLKSLYQTHAFLLRRGLHDHPILNFKLQRSYSSHGRLDLSVALFRRTPSPNIFFWTSLIHSHTNAGLNRQALSHYSDMLSDDVQPNCFALSAVLKGCPIEPGKVIHCHAVKLGFDSDLYVRTGLVDVYARAGDVWSAHHLFDKMPEKSLVSSTAMIACYAKHGRLAEARELFDGLGRDRDGVCWNVMIDGYAQHGSPGEALSLFRRMLVVRIRPSEITVLAVLSACGQIGAEDSGRWVHSYIENNGIQINAYVGTALIDMYCKCGSLEVARLVFESILDKDAVVWNSMIVGYAMHGFSHDALRLFREMQGDGHRPTDITFIGILTACAQAGLVTEGWEVFRSMGDEFRIRPKVEHYGCMVNLLGRAGYLEEAYDLVQSMSIDPDPVLWGTLLAACRLHGKTELGEKIAGLILSRGIANSGTYILLSNIYAASGNFEGVANVRALMKDSGVQKEPGCSSIEVNNKVHEFVAGDKKHARSEEIYAMLEEINGWLKASGYAPRTGIVLHDLGEREKRECLEVHSEKLAIAFGLISTRAGTAIKVVKNLRVCEDCHAVTKLISEITGRRIVMRDRNRFHHFENGSCSCGDYW